METMATERTDKAGPPQSANGSKGEKGACYRNKNERQQAMRCRYPCKAIHLVIFRSVVLQNVILIQTKSCRFRVVVNKPFWLENKGAGSS